VLAGHSDTVPYDDALWQTDPLKLTEVDGRWVGLGSCDMKGFFALIIEAVQPLLDQPFKQPLLILATCDEESSMSGARALAEAGRPLGRAAVIGEPTGLKPIRMHKGIMMERIDILGQSGHSSDPRLGHSALEAMHDAIGELRGLRLLWQREFNNPQFSVPQPTMNFGCIHGGDNPNRICGQCSLEFDLRPLPGMDPKVLRAAILQKLNPVAERHQVKIDYAPLFPEVPRSSRLKMPNWYASPKSLPVTAPKQWRSAPKRLIFSALVAKPSCSAPATSPARISPASTLKCHVCSLRCIYYGS
jgi:acetylornithine deacetylase